MDEIQQIISEVGSILENGKTSTYSRGEFGEKQGRYFIFQIPVSDKNGNPVIPNLKYIKARELEDDESGKKNIVVLKLNGQDSVLKFHKKDIQLGFGLASPTKHKIECTDSEFNVISQVILKLLKEEKYFKFFNDDLQKVKDKLNPIL